MSKESWRELYEKFQTPLEKLQFLNGLSELSWDDCQDAWFESNKLMPQIAAQLSAAEKERDSLKSKLAVAVEALEWYANPNHWEWTTYESTRDGCGCSDLRIYKYPIQASVQCGGKHASEALRAINGGG